MWHDIILCPTISFQFLSLLSHRIVFSSIYCHHILIPAIRPYSGYWECSVPNTTSLPCRRSGHAGPPSSLWEGLRRCVYLRGVYKGEECSLRNVLFDTHIVPIFLISPAFFIFDGVNLFRGKFTIFDYNFMLYLF